MPAGRRSTRRCAGSGPWTPSGALPPGEPSPAAVLIFEDLHWIDSETQALLDGLVECLPTRARPAPRQLPARVPARLGQQDLLHPAPHRSAAPRERRGVLEALLGEDGLSPAHAAVDRAHRGQPLLPRGERSDPGGDPGLVGDRGAYRLRRRRTLEIPATVQAILAARIDRLARGQTPASGRSVIGKDVPFALLQAIADMLEDEPPRGLDHLEASEFLYETSLFPDLEYTFKHALTLEVVYGGLAPGETAGRSTPGSSRQSRGFTPTGRAEHAEPLAHHAFRGEVWEKAVTYLRQAGRQGPRSLGLPGRQVTCFEQALGVLEASAGEPDHARAGLRDSAGSPAGVESARWRSGECWSDCVKRRSSPSG